MLTQVPPMTPRSTSRITSYNVCYTKLLRGRGIEWALTGRVEWLAAGNWDQFQDFSGWRGGEFGLLVGGAIHARNNFV